MTPSDDVSRFRFEKVVPVKVLKDLAAGVMNPKSLNKCFFFRCQICKAFFLPMFAIGIVLFIGWYIISKEIIQKGYAYFLVIFVEAFFHCHSCTFAKKKSPMVPNRDWSPSHLICQWFGISFGSETCR